MDEAFRKEDDWHIADRQAAEKQPMASNSNQAKGDIGDKMAGTGRMQVGEMETTTKETTMHTGRQKPKQKDRECEAGEAEKT